MAELWRRVDRVRRLVRPRAAVKLIAVEPGDICAFCHEELLLPPEDAPPLRRGETVHYRHCRWGCGKAVHTLCASRWGRDSCVYCAAPMS